MDENTPKPEKRCPGRPSLGRDARVVPFTLRVSENEIEAWRRLAEAQGMSVREYILAPHRRALKSKGQEA